MRKSEASRLASKEIARLQKEMALDRWEVDLTVGRCSVEGAVGESTVLGEYERVNITVDHLKCDGADELLEVVRHEMIHALLHPFNDFFDQIHPYFDDEKATQKIVERLFDKAIERAVLAVERSSLGKPPA